MKCRNEHCENTAMRDRAGCLACAEDGPPCSYGVRGCDADSEPHPENRCERHHADWCASGVDMAEMLRDE